MFRPKQCEELKLRENFPVPAQPVCEECVQSGSEWVHLRTCQSCGVTLCCDSSPNQHMTAHYEATAHPAVISAEPEERWIYCYKHDLLATF